MNEKLVTLFFKYLEGSCSPMEIDRVSELIARGGHDVEWQAAVQQLAEMLADADEQHQDYPEFKQLEHLRERILQDVRKELPIWRVDGRTKRWLSYAAAIVFVVFLGNWLYMGFPHWQLATQDEIAAVDAQSAGDRATLRFADGRAIELSAAKGGIVVANDRIRYKDGREEVISLNTFNEENLVLTTPKGGTYALVLPDGSQVWLNAASKLSYPARFNDKERLVEIEGEAYFAVSRDSDRPFKVVTRGQQILVLGTEFNVSAYTDDDQVKTTLISGAVLVNPAEKGNSKPQTRIKKSLARQLLPGEQSNLQGGDLIVKKVDVATEIGWKNGDFIFDGLELRQAMKQLSRWYNVEIVYEGVIPSTPFYGSFSRKFNLAKTLDILKEGNVNFSLKKQGDITKLIVKP